MSLQPGTTLGSYTVTAKIGEGGMGEMYRARDTNLDRDVALKVLPQAFTDDPGSAGEVRARGADPTCILCAIRADETFHTCRVASS